VTDVKPGTGGVREHIKAVKFGFIEEVFGTESLVFFPVTLPFLLNGTEIIFRIHEKILLFILLIHLYMKVIYHMKDDFSRINKR
jgi:hypothetical protein